VYCARGIGGLT